MDKTILEKVNEYFHNNESTKQYLQIISTALERQKDFQPTINKYVWGTVGRKKKIYFDFYNELHHIIPKSIDKELENYKPNWVILTGEEHFTVHKLLVDMCINKGNHYSMCGAYGSMCIINRGWEVTPEEYATAKELASEAHSAKMSGRQKSEEHKNKMSKAQKGIPKPNVSKALTGKKRKPFTQEHRDNMSKSGLGKSRLGKSRLGFGNLVECYIIVEGKEIILDKFNSLQEAKDKTNGNHSKITEASNGNRNYSGTYNIETKQYNERRFSGNSKLPNNNYPTTYKCMWRKIKE